MDEKQHLPLTPRDLLILSVLAEGPLHGYGIIKAVEGRSQSGVLLDPANLYRVLRRMRHLGWIRQATPYHESHETAESGGSPAPRRKTYEITGVGLSLLTAELARLERLLRYARPVLADGSAASGMGKGD